MSLPILLHWPDELALELTSFVGTDQIAALWRCDQYHEAELRLLVRLADDEDDLNCLVLLSLCADSLNRSAQYCFLIERLSKKYGAYELTRWLKIRHWLNSLDSESIRLAGDDVWLGEEILLF